MQSLIIPVLHGTAVMVLHGVLQTIGTIHSIQFTTKEREGIKEGDKESVGEREMTERM